MSENEELKEENEILINSYELNIKDYFIAHRILMSKDRTMALSAIRWYQDKYKYRFYVDEIDSTVFDCESKIYIGTFNSPLDTAGIWEFRLEPIFWESEYRECEYSNMPPTRRKRMRVYDSLSSSYEMPSFEWFCKYISDPINRKELYDATCDEMNYGSYEDFSKSLGY